MQTVSASPRDLLASSSGLCSGGLNGVFPPVCSAFMCHTRLSPCSSARTRRRETLPLPTVCAALQCSQNVWFFFSVPAMLLVLLLTSVFTCFSGMTVEVLGTVLGTAIQGQIVGGAPDCPIDLNGTDSNNETIVNRTSGFLEETVSFLTGSSSLSDCWNGFLREVYDKNGPGWRRLSAPRNKPTWLLQESSASSTSCALQCCFLG